MALPKWARMARELFKIITIQALNETTKAGKFNGKIKINFRLYLSTLAQSTSTMEGLGALTTRT
jgi:hypothetical protein